MDKKLILKMIQNSFKQYHRDLQSSPLGESEYTELYQQIIALKAETDADLHDIVNDVIYEFLTN
ncbi:YqzH family protein [Bacillus sp. CGMCC 1.16607]|uniref:YqzH family protein n=1 Tax=Bacillus sp. CGMCC 1.16607 TaxID=3351842 RepID=UPI00363D2435